MRLASLCVFTLVISTSHSFAQQWVRFNSSGGNVVEYVNLAEAIRVRASNGTGVVSVFPDKGQFDTKGEGVGIVDKAVSDSKGPWIQLSEDRMYVNSDKLSYVIFTGSACFKPQAGDSCSATVTDLGGKKWQVKSEEAAMKLKSHLGIK